MSIVRLRNERKSSVTPNHDDLYYPRLQANKHGEIVLALSKRGTLTNGILIAKAPSSRSKLKIGTRFSDWEVAGELLDYNGKVDVCFANSTRRQDVV